MKKKIVKTLMAAIMAAAILTGCGKNDMPPFIYTVEPESIEQETNNVTEFLPATEEETDEAAGDGTIITQRQVVDGKMQSFLTGEWKQEEVVKRRSAAVMMPNNKSALPQYGISRASIIYEAPVEGRITRLMCFFEDYDDLDHIGPVRSSRDYYVYEAMAYDAIYVNWGLARPFVEELINSSRIDNVSEAVAGIHNPASEAFERRKRPGYKTEFTGYMKIKGFGDAVERMGYSPEYTDRFVQAFTFANDGYPAEYEDHERAVRIYPGGKITNSGGYGNANPYFDYNEAEKVYYRYQYGSPHKDERNGDQITVSNVVFKICHGEVRDPKDKDYLAFGVHGEGEAYVFTNGRVIHGTWKRNSDYEPNLFLDENGEEIVFNQGKTWICNIWKEYQEFMEYE